MLTLSAPQVETLWDELLPVEARELPDDLAKLDQLLDDSALLAPIAQHWRAEREQRGRSAEAHGRPTIAMETYVRLMVIKQRSGFGYETLCREVSDSLHLRRFCLIPLHERVPDESTLRKLTRRLGPEVVAELTRALIEKAHRATALSSARGEDRLDGRRGRCALPDRLGSGRRRRALPGARRQAAGSAARPGPRRGQGPLACDLTTAAGGVARARSRGARATESRRCYA